MKKATALSTALTLGLMSLSSSVVAQVDYSDNFASDGSLSSSYLNINNISGSQDEWVFTPNTQLELTTATSSKLDDLVGQFNPFTLSKAGDSISFIVNFNSPNLGQAGTAGALLFSLDGSGGVGLLSAGPGPESPTATTGSTAGYVGYLGDIALNTTPKTGTKFFAKTGAGTNDLAYNPDALPDTQLATSVGNASNANLANNDSYTLTYTITALNAGDTQNRITAQIFDNTLGAMADNFSVIATNSVGTFLTPTTTYDTFDVGIYTGSETAGYNLNLTSLEITTVPEPSTWALAGMGVGLGFLARFRRR